MKRLTAAAAASACVFLGLIFLLYAFSSSNWISTCMPVASLILIPNTNPVEVSSYSAMRHPSAQRLKRGEYVIPGENERDLTMNRQLESEKNWISNKLNDLKLCATQGYFEYCISGDGFFQVGDYRLCVSTNVPGRVWSQSEKLTVTAIIFTSLVSVASIVLLFIVIRGSLQRVYPRVTDVCINIVAVVTFIGGTILLLGLLPVVVQSNFYLFNTTNFYNDMVHRLATIYSVVMEVNWSIKDGDLTDVQAWARTVVANMTDLGLDRDFYLALTSAVLLYTACCCLLLRSKDEPERPPSPSRFMHKQS
ncbi:uncharacterized protein LOC143445046 [Clavelina lepadiformis]|uniref:uncharacterized protein LOC143445046 n=1 Tax=Clavelina lepadiformis TaxID=159417 RepID=UPI0040417AA2